MDNNYSNSLDQSLAEFQKLLQQSSELIINRYTGLDEAKAYAGFAPAEVKSWFDESVPQQGMPNEDLLELVKSKVLDPATLNIGPNMFAYVMAGGTQVSVLAEMLGTAINQNVGKWHLAPVMSELEKRVIQWGAEFIGYDPQAGGVLVSGGSAANLTGLTVARNLFFEKENVREKGLFGMKP
ncbi:MAG: pyridoxal-dependent decarboxylase, partial [Daejeonella sp.]